MRKRISLLILALILVLSAGLYGLYYTRVNRNSQRESEVNQKNELAKELSTQENISDVPSITGTSVQQAAEEAASSKDNTAEISTQSNENANQTPKSAAPKNVPAQTINTKERIDCSFETKEGSKKNKAIASWNCKNHIGWTCDLKWQYDDTIVKNIKLPSGSAEVNASAPIWNYSKHGWDPGIASYEIRCSSVDGRKKSFYESQVTYP